MEKVENLDLGELHKFSSRAEQWWQPDGEFKTLHQINPVSLGFITQQTALNNKQVLDIGCGGGILSEAMAKQGAKVTAIDASEENITIASVHATDNQLEIDYQVSLVEAFADKNETKFDVICCMELLEHVPEPDSIIKACSKMIKSGGHVIFSTINRNIRAYMLAVLAGEYFLQLLPKGTHQYEKFIRPSELINGCNEHGLKLNNLAGMDYNPLLNHCTLSKNTDVNYLISTVKAE